MTRQCRSCGAPLPVEARFCPTCGAGLSPPPAATGDASAVDSLERSGQSQDELETATRPPGVPPGLPRREAVALQPGRAFGPYRLIRRIGEGGFGQVWEAVHVGTGRRVALKVLMAAPPAGPERIERFKREGRLAASLSHPNCVYVFSAEEIEGQPAITMELMPGGTLQDLVRKDGPLPYRKAVDCTLDILDGLEAAHAAGVIHRDIKPSNCFLGPSGSVRVGDFGLARTLEADSDLTATGSFVGTPAYASPEQVRGRDVDASSDLYSIGATLYTLLTGRSPFAGAGGAQLLARILTEPPTPISDHGVRVPAGLQRVVMRLLAKEKSRRYPGCGVLRAALRPYSSGGLAMGGLGGRLAAILVDTAAIQAAVGLVAGAEYFVRPLTLPHQLSALALTFVYFAFQEWLWGRSLGKRLFGLRVVTAEGGTPGPGSIALRVGLFAGVLYAPVIGLLVASPGGSSPDPSRSLPFWVLGIALPYAALLGTMRSSNGFAALHDLASRTRVKATVPSRSSVPDVTSRLAAPAEPSARSFAPYEDARVVWATASESLLVARDPELRREVWVHSFQDGARALPPSSLTRDRPGRLRWLQGSRAAGDTWDAYEAPSGIGLAEWVAAKGKLPWASLREILLDLAEELEAREGGPEAATPPSVRHVWVDGHGQTRLLDFPSRPGPGERVREWRSFLHQVLLFGCEGRLLGPPPLGRTPGVPLPEYARPLVRLVCGLGPPPSRPAEVAARLTDVAGRPPGVSRLRRLGPLFVTAVPGLFMLFSVTLALLGAPDVVRLAGTLRRAGAALERLDAVGAPEPERERALRLLQARAYAELRDVSTSSSNPVAVRVATEALGSLEADERAAAEALSRERRPTAAELADARRELEAIEPSASPWGLTLGFLLFGIAPLAIPALLLAPLARGGALLWLFGTSLQTLDGRRAGRVRSLLRAAVVWAPFVLFQLWQPWTVFHVVFPLVLAAGVGSALARPERGIPDLVVGTHLVPR
jgi:uncharacterized RDD family membrane protein YckC